MTNWETLQLADQLRELPNLMFLELKYSHISLESFVAVLIEARVLKLVSVVDCRFFFTEGKCRRFDRWLKRCDFKNKQYTMLEPPESGRGKYAERAIEFSHSDMGFAFVKPERFWQKGTLILEVWERKPSLQDSQAHPRSGIWASRR